MRTVIVATLAVLACAHAPPPAAPAPPVVLGPVIRVDAPAPAAAPAPAVLPAPVPVALPPCRLAEAPPAPRPLSARPAGCPDGFAACLDSSAAAGLTEYLEAMQKWSRAAWAKCGATGARKP